MEQFIFDNSMDCLNQPGINTFESSVGSSNIDLTISGQKLFDDIVNWKVLGEDILSGHRFITFHICIDPVLKQKLNLAVRKTNWSKYREEFTTNLEGDQHHNVMNKLKSTPSINNIDSTSDPLTNVYKLTTSKVVPTKITIRTSVPWWNSALQTERTKTNSLRHKFQKSRSDTDWENYKTQKKIYNQTIHKSKWIVL